MNRPALATAPTSPSPAAGRSPPGPDADAGLPSLRPWRPARFDDLVRVGRDHDGGYIVPARVFPRSAALLSLGVNDDWSFEEGALARNPALRITCVDGTTGLWRVIVKSAQQAVDLVGAVLTLRLDKARRNARYVATRVRDFRRFFARHELLPLMVGAAPGPGRITLPELLDRVGTGPVLLKCDIEGDEYEVLPTAAGRWSDVSALLVEFHALSVNRARFEACMRALADHFVVAHVHGNNFGGYVPGTGVPDAIEVTLVNRALLDGATPEPSPRRYPLAGLDQPCRRRRPDLPLAFD